MIIPKTNLIIFQISSPSIQTPGSHPFSLPFLRLLQSFSSGYYLLNSPHHLHCSPSNPSTLISFYLDSVGPFPDPFSTQYPNWSFQDRPGPFLLLSYRFLQLWLVLGLQVITNCLLESQVSYPLPLSPVVSNLEFSSNSWSGHVNSSDQTLCLSSKQSLWPRG
jgi:hypothetical protein